MEHKHIKVCTIKIMVINRDHITTPVSISSGQHAYHCAGNRAQTQISTYQLI